MSNSNSNNDGDKREQSGKTFPINLAAKVASVKSPDGSKSSLILGTQSIRTLNQSHMRVLATSLPNSSSSTTPHSSGTTLISTIVPQPILKAGSHVPCGPAAVANLAVPRGATPIRGITVNQTSTVRQLVPPRTPSPANVIQTGTSWTSNTTLQVQTSSANNSTTGAGTKINQNPLLVSQTRGGLTTLPIVQGRASITRGSHSQIGSSTNTASRPTTAVLHPTIQTYKPVQSLATSLTVSQVGNVGTVGTSGTVSSTKAVTGQTLVYTTVTNAQHLPQTQRLTVGGTSAGGAHRQLANRNNTTISNVSTSTQQRLTGGTHHQSASGPGAATAVLTTGRLAVVVANTTQPQQITFASQQANAAVGAGGSTKVISHGSSIGAGSTLQLTSVTGGGGGGVSGGQQQSTASIAAAKLTAQLQQQSAAGILTANLPITVTPTTRSGSFGSGSGGQPIRFGQIYVERSGFANAVASNISSGSNNDIISGALLQQSPASEQIQLQSVGKQTSSPRPSILRKRENDSSTLKAVKNLTPVLATLSASCLPPVSPPSRPDSRGTGQSSAGSTTISATSSPGPDESPSPPIGSGVVVNQINSTPTLAEVDDSGRPPIEMSPRKKPRKQQLTGNDLQEPRFDIQFLSDRVKEEAIQPKRITSSSSTRSHHSHNQQSQQQQHQQTTGEVTVKKPTPASLLNSYHQTWKSTHNHFVRYTDVKPKEERQQSIMDIANQKRILQKIKGWKIYHLTAQMEDLSDFEMQVHSKLGNMLKMLESKDPTGRNKDLDRINDLIKGNMQRSKIINDGMLDAKVQVMKIFDHKNHAADIINRCASKRNYKKREKS